MTNRPSKRARRGGGVTRFSPATSGTTSRDAIFNQYHSGSYQPSITTRYSSANNDVHNNNNSEPNNPATKNVEMLHEEHIVAEDYAIPEVVVDEFPSIPDERSSTMPSRVVCSPSSV